MNQQEEQFTASSPRLRLPSGGRARWSCFRVMGPCRCIHSRIAGAFMGHFHF